jgi:hypothetical protein
LPDELLKFVSRSKPFRKKPGQEFTNPAYFRKEKPGRSEKFGISHFFESPLPKDGAQCKIFI